MADQPDTRPSRGGPINAAIVGGGKGCESVLKMVKDDTLGRFSLRIQGVADVDPQAPGLRYAREIGIPLVTTDYRELYEIPDLHLIIELTGKYEVRDEIERTRPRKIRLIDHFGARLFWELHQAQEAVIHQRTEMRERVEAERVRIAQILNSIPDEILVLDSEMIVQDANTTFLRNNNLTIDDVRGRHCYEIDQHVRGECQVAVGNCPFFTVIKEGQPTSLVRKHFGADGQVLYAAIVGAPLLDAEGNVHGMIEMTRNITAQKEAEIKLNETREYLQKILDNSPVIIVTTDLEGNIVSFNRGAEESLGYTAAEVIGRPAALFYRDPTKRDEFLRLVKSGKAVKDYSYELLRKDGTPLPVSITLSQLKDSEGNMIGTVGMSKDISKRKALLGQMLQSERMAAVGRLASGVAHEINNPLAVIGEIAGFLGALLEEGAESDDVEFRRELEEGLPKILKQVTRIRDITQRLLTFARKTEARVDIADVNGSLDEILPFLQKEASLAQATIHRDYQEDLPRVPVDEMQLQEVFINLITNALHAVAKKEGGNVWLTTRTEGGKVVITIKDDGPGIDDSIRDRLFEPFVSTKANGQGTGLGLSICYGIVKRYDGEIRVFSEPGQGATFKVILPAHIPTSRPPGG